MQKMADIILEDNQFFLTGELGFTNVMELFKKSLTEIHQCKEINLNFSKLIASDSSLLALVIEWIKLANTLNKPIYFFDFPKKLLSIAKIASLDSLISCSSRLYKENV